MASCRSDLSTCARAIQLSYRISPLQNTVEAASFPGPEFSPSVRSYVTVCLSPSNCDAAMEWVASGNARRKGTNKISARALEGERLNPSYVGGGSPCRGSLRPATVAQLATSPLWLCHNRLRILRRKSITLRFPISSSPVHLQDSSPP